MDISRSLKRVVLIIALSVIVILVSKSLLSRAVKNLNIEAQKKQQAKIAMQRAALPQSAPSVETSSSPAIADNASAPAEPVPAATETNP